MGIVTRRYRFGTTRDRRLSACWQARELISLVTTEAVVDTGGLSDHHGVVVEIDLAARVLFEDGLDP